MKAAFLFVGSPIWSLCIRSGTMSLLGFRDKASPPMPLRIFNSWPPVATDHLDGSPLSSGDKFGRSAFRWGLDVFTNCCYSS